MMKRDPARLRVLALVLLVAGGILLLPLDLVETVSLHTALVGQAHRLVDEAIGRNMSTFLVASGIKATLALLEGSSIGVGFQLQVGDLVQPLYDYVDIVWRILFYSVLILGLYKVILETGILALGLKILGLGLMLWAGGLFIGLRTQDGRSNAGAFVLSWARRFVFVGLLACYAGPLILLGTETVSRHFLEPVKEKYETRAEMVQAQLLQTRTQVYALKDEISLTRPGESLERLRVKALAVAQEAASIAWDSLTALVYVVMIICLELLLLPLISAILLYKLLKLTVDDLFEKRTVVHVAQPAAGKP